MAKHNKNQSNRDQQRSNPEVSKLKTQNAELQKERDEYKKQTEDWELIASEIEEKEKQATEALQRIEQNEAQIRQEYLTQLKEQVIQGAKTEALEQIKQENGALIEKAQADAQKIRSTAQEEAAQEKARIVAEEEAHIAEQLKVIQDNEAQIRQEYFDELKARAEQEVKENSQKQFDAATQQAEGIIQQARKQAEPERQNIIDTANKEATRLVEKATIEADRIGAVKRHELDLKEHELATRGEALANRERSLDRKEQRLQTRESDIELEWQQIAQEKKNLQAYWEQCSPDQVAALGNEVKTLKKYHEADQQIIQSLQTENARLRGLLPGDGTRSGEMVLEELHHYRQRSQELADQLANCPSPEMVNLWKSEAAELKQLRGKYEILQSQFYEVKDRASRLELGNRELEQVKIQADALRVLNDELRKELKLHKDTLKQRTDERFAELVRIDSETIDKPMANTLPANFSLQNLVTHVRNYAATLQPTPLYYSEQAICAFIAGLSTSRLTILQGLSGTGKTSLPRVFVEAIGGQYRNIPVQSSWRDRHELLGYNNDFSKRFNETEFTKAIYTACLSSQEEIIWLIVLDEINLSRVEYYFADFISILEEPDPKEWLVSLMSFKPEGPGGPQRLVDGYQLKVPENLWFIGTANQDESTFEVTDKVYDRAQVIEFSTRQTEFNVEKDNAEPVYVSCTQLQQWFKDARKSSKGLITPNDREKIEDLDMYMFEHFGITFANRIEEQMKKFVPVYVAARGGTAKDAKNEALDHLFARKVLRKLERQHDPNMKKKLEELKQEIQIKFPGKESIEWIDRKIRRGI